ncbi:MAG: hypothetical protein ACK5N8_06970 [Alphaproteobacteria bacterium]
MKKSLLALLISLAFLSFSKEAKADFCAITYVSGQVTVAQEFVQNGVRYADTQITELRELAKYDPRNLVDIEADFIKIPKITKPDLSVQGFLEDVNSTEKTKKNLEENVLSQITVDTEETTRVSQQQEMDRKSKRMKDFADLYAKALTTRTNIARSELEGKERTSSQSIIKNTSAVDNRTIARLNNIRTMSVGNAEFLLMDRSRPYSNKSADEGN